MSLANYDNDGLITFKHLQMTHIQEVCNAISMSLPSIF